MISLPIWVFVVLVVLASLPVVVFCYILVLAILTGIWERKVIKAEHKIIEKKEE